MASADDLVQQHSDLLTFSITLTGGTNAPSLGVDISAYPGDAPPLPPPSFHCTLQVDVWQCDNCELQVATVGRYFLPAATTLQLFQALRRAQLARPGSCPARSSRGGYRAAASSASQTCVAQLQLSLATTLCNALRGPSEITP